MSPRRAKSFDGGGSELREHLIDTCERLLAERPPAALTTREIARSANVSDGVLYNYFTDKNELVITALVRRYLRVADQFGTALPRPGTNTVEQNLLAHAEATLRLHLESLPVVAGLLADPDLLRGFIDAIHAHPQGPQSLGHRLIEYLAGEHALGRLTVSDPAPATILFTGATLMLALTTLLTGTPDDPYTQLPAVVTTLVHGLSPG